MDFAFPANHSEKIKVSEKIDKNLDLGREKRKLWNMNMTMIPIVTGALGMIPKSLERRLEELEIGGRIETIETTTLLKLTSILRRVPKDLRRIAVTQTPVKDHTLTLV